MIRTIHNPNCDGGHCLSDIGEVRVYPLGGGGNLILCKACFNYENAYRKVRAKETRSPENWPQVEWDTAERYPLDEINDPIPGGAE